MYNKVHLFDPHRPMAKVSTVAVHYRLLTSTSGLNVLPHIPQGAQSIGSAVSVYREEGDVEATRDKL